MLSRASAKNERLWLKLNSRHEDANNDKVGRLHIHPHRWHCLPEGLKKGNQPGRGDLKLLAR